MTTYYIDPKYATNVQAFAVVASELSALGLTKLPDTKDADIIIGTRQPIRGKLVVGPFFYSNKTVTAEVLEGKPYIPKTWKGVAETKKGQLYFVKPERGSKGAGIKLIEGDGKRFNAKKAVIQEAVPSLILPFMGSLPRKFDIRFHASLTILPDGTAQILTNNDAYMRFSSSPYMKGVSKSELTNVAQQDSNGYKDCLCNLSQYHNIEAGGPDLTPLIGKMKSYASDALRAYFTKFVVGKKRFKGAAMTNIYGFDFIVTEDGKDVKILEINTTPQTQLFYSCGYASPLPLMPIIMATVHRLR